MMSSIEDFQIRTECTKNPQWQAVDFSNLEFGRVATDHMFITEFHDGNWHDARIVPFAELRLSPFASALHYGQTVFEGMKAFRMADSRINIFRPVSNLQRLNQSVERMCMPQVPESLFMKALDQLIRLESNWVSDADGASLYIRPFMFASDSKLGVRVADNYIFMIVCSPVGKYYSHSLKVKIEQHYARAFHGGTGFAKCGGNYGVSFYPYQKAHDEGFDQVIWTDAGTHQFIEESGTMNIGFIIGQKFITPLLGDTILPGITRNSLLSLVPQLGLQVEERNINYHEIVSAIEKGEKVEAFGMGTAAVIAPIREIWADGKPYTTYTGPDASMFRLRDLFNDIRLGKKDDVFNWNYIL